MKGRKAMYQALYRKYRPASFDDVISQSAVTETLKNQIISGKTAHAYLFTGSRGTGKTTCARILAKALVCEHTKNGEPCLECDICRDMDAGALSDIIEIDAASNGGVDDARMLREAASYIPERCKYKIYIIDEVHMLSAAAFNALLKIIEEPPPHIKFIMATTEIHKVIGTILSRCQRFDFKRIKSEDIAKRLLYIAEKENIELEESAAELIARTSDGGMRDAVSLLDRCAAVSKHIGADTVSEAAGLAGDAAVLDIIRAILSSDVKKALEVISSAYENSKDMSKLLSEMITALRNVLVIKSVPSPEKLVVCSAETLERYGKMASSSDERLILSAMDELSACSERLSRSLSKRTELEMTVIKLCGNGGARGASSEETEALRKKISELEDKIRTLSENGAVSNAPRRYQPRASSAPKEAVTDTSGMKDDPARLSCWADILEKFGAVCPAVNGTLQGSQAYESGEFLLIVTDNNFFISLLRVKENALLLQKTIFEVTGRNYKLRAKCTAENNKDTNDSRLSGLLKKAAENGIPTDVDNT